MAAHTLRMLLALSAADALLFSGAFSHAGQSAGTPVDRAGNPRKKSHPLFPHLEDTQGGRLPIWKPTSNDTKRCDDHQKPKYCLHFARRRWCVESVEQREADFGKTWTFSEKEGRDGRNDFAFCQQYRFNDLVQKRKRLDRKKRKLAFANSQLANSGVDPNDIVAKLQMANDLKRAAALAQPPGGTVESAPTAAVAVPGGQKLATLKQELAAAVAREDYTAAAAIQKALKAKGKGKGKVKRARKGAGR